MQQICLYLFFFRPHVESLSSLSESCHNLRVFLRSGSILSSLSSLTEKPETSPKYKDTMIHNVRPFDRCCNVMRFLQECETANIKLKQLPGGQYYCSVFHFVCKSGWEGMLSVTDAACVTTAAEVYYYLNKWGGDDPPQDNRTVQKKTTTDTWKSHDRLPDEWAKWLKNFLWLDGKSTDEILNTLNPTTGKRNTNIQKLSLSASIYTLQDAIWTPQCLWSHKIHKCHISSIHWNYFSADVFTD